MELVYCHTIPNNDPWLNCDKITTGYYYCQSYYFGPMKCYDLKESNDRYSKTLWCFRHQYFDNFFYTKEQMRDLKINEILKIDE